MGERFPLAGDELEKLGSRALARTRGRRTFVVTVRRADGLSQEQLRILSDQFHNALGRERNALKQHPTRVRGICMFSFEAPPEGSEARFLLHLVRPRNPLVPIQSLAWVIDLAGGQVG